MGLLATSPYAARRANEATRNQMQHIEDITIHFIPLKLRSPASCIDTAVAVTGLAPVCCFAALRQILAYISIYIVGLGAGAGWGE